MLGFARTLGRSVELPPPADRYVEMIDLAAGQIADLLDDLTVVARIEAGRWEPATAATSVDELVSAAAVRAGAGVATTGGGGYVRVEREAAARALGALARAALRHGRAESVELRGSGGDVAISPVGPDLAPIVLGEDLRDLGAAVSVRVLRALGAEMSAEGETLHVRLPPDPGDPSRTPGKAAHASDRRSPA